MTGFYQMHRGWMDNPLFKGESFTKAQAWEWLIANAAWKDRTITVNNKSILVKRGQLFKSIRMLATDWDWPPTKVVRFLKSLETEEMVETSGGTRNGTNLTQITICNYDKFQVPRHSSGTADGTLFGTTIEESLKESSVSKDTAIVVDPLKIFFDSGDAVLSELDPTISKNTRRSLLAKLRQTFSDDIETCQLIISDMADIRPSDPKSWLMARRPKVVDINDPTGMVRARGGDPRKHYFDTDAWMVKCR
jgi:hypothetical protein